MERLAWAIFAPLAIALLQAGSASAATQCSSEGFCVEQELTLTTNPPGLVAAAPTTVDLSVKNTSVPYSRADWLEGFRIALPTANPGELPSLTPSASLPNKLLIAGGSPCAPPTYSECAGGHGQLSAHVTPPPPGSPFNTTGAFGLQIISNVNPPVEGALADYKALLRVCFVIGPECSLQAVEEIELKIGSESNGELVMPTEEPESELFGYKIEFAVKSISLHFDGESNRLEGGGTTPQPYPIYAMPRECGTLKGSATFVSHEAGSVTFEEEMAVTGCPTAALAPYRRLGAIAELDGSPSSTPLAGRSIARWHWHFGDGTETVTTTPTVTHEYRPGTEHTVTLVAEDSAGALSPPVTQSVTMPPGDLLKVSVSGPGTVNGNEIACPKRCTAILPPGTQVTLGATPAAGYVLSGWGGACSGTGGCALTMSGDREVTAKFAAPPERLPVPPIQPVEPPDTRITKTKVGKRKVTFRFVASGPTAGFKCALAKRGRRLRLRSCKSPKTYRRLKSGRYTFEVETIGPGGADPTPARRKFRIRP